MCTSISGSILDQDNEPIYGAEVIASTDEDTLRASTNHDGEQRFDFSGLSEEEKVAASISRLSGKLEMLALLKAWRFKMYKLATR